MTDFNLQEAYDLFNVDSNTSLEDLEKAYLKLVGIKLNQGKKDELKIIKTTYQKLVDYKINKQEQEEKQIKKNLEDNLTQQINSYLKFYNLKVQINPNQEVLNILVKGNQATKKNKIIKLIQNILPQIELSSFNKILIQAITADKSIIWSEEIRIYKNQSSTKFNYKTDILLQKAERNNNIFALPIAFCIASVISIFEPLTWFISMWIHEFGHATIAWLSGYRAMVTFGGTVTSLEKSWFVYGGILFLLALCLWYGKKEQKKFVMIVAVILAVVQFLMTWMISQPTYRMFLAFGGIGGEFYLSTFLIVAFYFNLPQKFYWEFWRYIALIISTITFWSSFWKWHHIQVGQEAIPWGSFWGGRGDSGGDLNVLAGEFGWNSWQIITTYSFLADICLLIIISFYLYFLTKSYPNLWFNIYHFFRKLWQ